MSGISYPKCFALVSGGKDSLSTAQVLHDAGKLEGCVALETGLCTPDWKEFVQRTCEERKWPVKFYPTTESYEAWVMKMGYPGPGMHGRTMNMLKGRAIRVFRKAHPTGILASGVRSDESDRRTLNTKPVSFWEGAPVLAPIFDWSNDGVWSFFRNNFNERAPAYSTLQISGDCLCGAYAREGEREALEFHYPVLGKYLRELGEAVKAKFPKRWEWGWGWKKPIKRRTQAERVICVECAPRDIEEQPA